METRVSRIPNKFHRIPELCGDDRSRRCQEFLEESKFIHPDWENHLWTLSEIEHSVDRERENDTYQKCDSPVMRRDVGSYMLIKEYGGVYLGLDTTHGAPLDFLLSRHPGAQVILFADHDDCGYEGFTHWEDRRNRFRIANYAFASVARHPFWSDVLELVKDRIGLTSPVGAKSLGRDAFRYVTGSDVLTTVYHSRDWSSDGVYALWTEEALQLIEHHPDDELLRAEEGLPLR